ncbi:AGE family epimerase/isomerase [Flavihumibacter profundi]|uniref:AGE family epimerase/isomerase n=1 Tax=Flavihumibacter profundi TaxID=2716883 RepID=UPI001CC761B1|nr:AGE family epimerase/isomerase [Flavihumibacter profundi]MBZ5857211.1 AGE family epimerase/isomerase [Flavihumibacter profundi]
MLITNTIKRLTICCILLQLNLFVFAQAGRLTIADEMEKSINTELLNKWYPRSIDSLYGGFLTTYTYDFKPTGPQDKFIVTQARHTWTTAKAAMHYPGNLVYLKYAKHGYKFLRDVMWDKTYGGFYQMTDRKGHVKTSGVAAKEAYGNAFAIYALAAYYEASKDPSALELAKKSFAWLEKNSHDPVAKGYFQHLSREGKPLRRNAATPALSELGYKDQNSSIHLLEAFTELYSIWPDPLLKERLSEMLLLIRDKITTPKGYLVLFFQPDWTPVSYRDASRDTILKYHNLDHVSFGHDIETAYLMLEASHALGWVNDTATQKVAKKMVDHALENGWDTAVGGFYDEGYYFKDENKITIIKDTKNWWAQAEGLNTLLLMADIYPNDPNRYYQKFTTMWTYINTYLIDHQYGDWYDEGLDKSPDRKTALKGHIWKATYHHYRSMHNCIQRLCR